MTIIPSNQSDYNNNYYFFSENKDNLTTVLPLELFEKILSLINETDIQSCVKLSSLWNKAAIHTAKVQEIEKIINFVNILINHISLTTKHLPNHPYHKQIQAIKDLLPSGEIAILSAAHLIAAKESIETIEKNIADILKTMEWSHLEELEKLCQEYTPPLFSKLFVRAKIENEIDQINFYNINDFPVEVADIVKDLSLRLCAIGLDQRAWEVAEHVKIKDVIPIEVYNIKKAVILSMFRHGRIDKALDLMKDWDEQYKDTSLQSSVYQILIDGNLDLAYFLANKFSSRPLRIHFFKSIASQAQVNFKLTLEKRISEEEEFEEEVSKLHQFISLLKKSKILPLKTQNQAKTIMTESIFLLGKTVEKDQLLLISKTIKRKFTELFETLNADQLTKLQNCFHEASFGEYEQIIHTIIKLKEIEQTNDIEKKIKLFVELGRYEEANKLVSEIKGAKAPHKRAALYKLIGCQLAKDGKLEEAEMIANKITSGKFLDRELLQQYNETLIEIAMQTAKQIGLSEARQIINKIQNNRLKDAALHRLESI